MNTTFLFLLTQLQFDYLIDLLAITDNTLCWRAECSWWAKRSSWGLFLKGCYFWYFHWFLGLALFVRHPFLGDFWTFHYGWWSHTSRLYHRQWSLQPRFFYFDQVLFDFAQFWAFYQASRLFAGTSAQYSFYVFCQFPYFFGLLADLNIIIMRINRIAYLTQKVLIRTRQLRIRTIHPMIQIRQLIKHQLPRLLFKFVLLLQYFIISFVLLDLLLQYHILLLYFL